MNTFIHEHFLLNTQSARQLYDTYVKHLPIIDYHSHLNPKQICQNESFENITQAWLAGDHYKWRAMRTLGVDEHFITGNATDREKFDQWANVMPKLLKNPLYHWSHLELARPFGITDLLLSPETADEIWNRTNAFLQETSTGARSILEMMNVKIICTTDDPIDDLHYHLKHNSNCTALKMYPTWRPDKARAIGNPILYNQWIQKLEQRATMPITTLGELKCALQKQHDFFASVGCIISDHSLELFGETSCSETEADAIFKRTQSGLSPTLSEQEQFSNHMMHFFATLDFNKNWVRQLHIGAMRNPNEKMFTQLGPDTGFDAIADISYAKPLALLLNRSAKENQLPRTILYNLNPKENEMLAVLCGSFQDGTVGGRMQWGAAWWFLDQLDGMKRHIQTLSQLGALSQFIGMLTDSRSVLSMSRHDYFRRLLCNILGDDMEKGIVPNQLPMVGKLASDIAFNNAKAYFKF